MSLEEVRGDLFEVAARNENKDYALAHCISEDVKMGKGIAVLFRDKFKGIDQLEVQVRNGKKTGKAAVLLADNRHVFYLITKAYYYNKPTYDSLRASLQDMRARMEQDGVEGVLMPRIGCGLDKLTWDRVKPIIQETLTQASGNDPGKKVIICVK